MKNAENETPRMRLTPGQKEKGKAIRKGRSVAKNRKSGGVGQQLNQHLQHFNQHKH